MRFVGDPVACVIAETVNQGKGRARSRRGRYRSPPRRDVGARKRQAGRAADLRRSAGQRRRATGISATAKRSRPRSRGAAHVVKMPLRNTRVVVASMEAARFHRELRQGVGTLHGLHRGAEARSARRWRPADVLKVAPDKVHAILNNTGGSFGMKAPVFPRICVRRTCGARARPPGQMDRRAHHLVPLGHPRPRPRSGDRACAGQGWPLSRRPHHGYGNSGAYISMMGTMQPTMDD